jgi:hypothetical protein
VALHYDTKDPEAYESLERVLRRHDHFNPIRADEFTFVLALASQIGESQKPPLPDGAKAFIKQTNSLDRACGVPDIRVVIDAERWEGLSLEERDALIAHELYHMEPTGKRDSYDRPLCTMIDADVKITGFREVAEWYGERSMEVKSYRAFGELLKQALLPFPDDRDLPGQTHLPFLQAERTFPATADAVEETIRDTPSSQAASHSAVPSPVSAEPAKKRGRPKKAVASAPTPEERIAALASAPNAWAETMLTHVPGLENPVLDGLVTLGLVNVRDVIRFVLDGSILSDDGQKMVAAFGETVAKSLAAHLTDWVAQHAIHEIDLGETVEPDLNHHPSTLRFPAATG